jgi:hypothetical protein
MAFVEFDLKAFDKSEKMADIRKNLGESADQGKFDHVIPFAKLKDLDESVMVFRLLTSHGYHVGSHQEGMLVKW